MGLELFGLPENWSEQTRKAYASEWQRRGSGCKVASKEEIQVMETAGTLVPSVAIATEVSAFADEEEVFASQSLVNCEELNGARQNECGDGQCCAGMTPTGKSLVAKERCFSSDATTHTEGLSTYTLTCVSGAFKMIGSLAATLTLLLAFDQ